jgi:PAS domain S-box-containing protein
VSEQSVAPTAAAPPGSVHELLRQLVESHFVLTDRDGAVTRWSAPAQALFGWEPHGMLGRTMLETLGMAVSPPRHGGRVTAGTRLRDGREIEVELVFIPVRMSQSLEFNGFLSALEQMSAAALSVERLRSGHYGVVDWIEASMNGEGTLDDDELAAGTIVTFRPTTPIDFFDNEQDDERYEELDDFDDIERALAGTATSVEEARTDAAAARSEAAVASERVGTLEAQLEQTRALVEALAGELTANRGATAEETAALVESLREELERARGATIEESRALVEALRSELSDAPGVSPEEASALVESLRAELKELREQQPEQDAIVELREGLDKVRKRVRQAAEQDFGAQIEAMHSELSVLRANSTEDATRDSEALEQLIADVEQQAKDARKAAGRVEEAAARAGAHAQTAAAVGQQLDEKVARVEEAALKLEQSEGHATRAEAAAATVEAAAEKAERQFEEATARAEQAAEKAERHLEEAREAAEQAALEAEVARVQAEAAQTRPRRRTRTSAGAPSANGQADLHAPLFGREDDKGPERELRTGFDDVKEPMARIALDGHFRELNKPFSELVGYKEKEFAACTWPPVMDRANLPKHREQMRALMAGEATSVEVNTGYVHAQGLLVPVVGKLSLRRTDGEPDHFLLELVRP